MLGLDKNTVKLVPYCEEWPRLFENEKEILQQVLGDIALSIEHAGSTSVPGLSSKPIIDIYVGVKDFDVLRETIKIMQENGYDDVRDEIAEKEEVLAHRGPQNNRTHHIHIIIQDSPRYKNTLLFRDYLRSHEEAMREYQALKLSLAEKYRNERPVYTASKNDFIQSIIKKAQQESA